MTDSQITKVALVLVLLLIAYLLYRFDSKYADHKAFRDFLDIALQITLALSAIVFSKIIYSVFFK